MANHTYWAMLPCSLATFFQVKPLSWTFPTSCRAAARRAPSCPPRTACIAGKAPGEDLAGAGGAGRAWPDLNPEKNGGDKHEKW